MNILKKVLEEKVIISDEDWNFISQKLQYKSVAKKDIILKTHQVEQNIYFIEKGVFRFFIETPEKDITFDFAFSNDIMSSYTSFLTQTPSQCCIQCLTDSQLCYISYTNLQAMYAQTQAGQALGRVLVEELFMYKSKREVSFLKDSPKERYLKLFEEQPHLIQEIPQIYLSSYIGITPQALSRIRAKL